MKNVMRRTPRLAPTFSNLMDRFFEDFWTDFSPMNRSYGPFGDISPTVNVKEDDNCFMLAIDLPGVSKENLSVDVKTGVLSISAERKNVFGEGEEKQESHFKFQKSFTLPANVDPEKVEANLEDGVLQIMLPKTTTQHGRKIEIGTKAGGFWNKMLGGKEKEAQPGSKKVG